MTQHNDRDPQCSIAKEAAGRLLDAYAASARGRAATCPRTAAHMMAACSGFHMLLATTAHTSSPGMSCSAVTTTNTTARMMAERTPVRCIEVLMEDVGSRDSNDHNHSCSMDRTLLPFPCAVCFSFLYEQKGSVGGTPRLRVPFSCHGSVDSSPTWRSGQGRR